MAFFDLPQDHELAPEVSRMLDEHRRMLGADQVSVGWRAFGRIPKIIEARFIGHRNLFHQCSFPWEIKNLAWMLIAHAKKCQDCFTYCRSELDKLGWDEAKPNGVCANPEALPLKERDRTFVQYALKIAMDPGSLKLQDFKDMQARGLSREEIQEIIAFTAYLNMYMTFTLSQPAWLAEE